MSKKSVCWCVCEYERKLVLYKSNYTHIKGN